MTKLVIDAYAWIEYFKGSAAGERTKEFVETERNIIYTNIFTVSEVVSFMKRQNKDWEAAVEVILTLSNIFILDIGFAKEAGLLHAELRKTIKDIGLADVHVLLTARKLGAKTITGDPHFKGFKETIMI